MPTYKKGMEIESIKYKTVQIGKQVWTAENMRHVSGKNTFSTNFDNGIYSYKDKLSNDKEYGKYYTWSAAMKGATKEGAQGICAPGWHIPTAYDWKVLQRYLGMDTADLNKNGVWIGNDQGTQLKVGGASGFEAVMTGVTLLNIVPINSNPYYNKDIFNGGIANGLGMEDHGLFHGGIVSDIGIVSNPKPFDIYDLLNNIAQPDSTINIEQDRTYFWSSSSHSGVALSMGLDRSKP
ncbi:FISUMP domain-containing protein, partial [Bathymodiolus thermophilus thioautotrophic gill symbiont]|uniref:FISUMP domain-containing protein n=1 Tax=Bathymodiolus thermophilus thioautotrophic gill symbiont TaxID=2360 RepID=UPI0023B05F38